MSRASSITYRDTDIVSGALFVLATCLLTSILIFFAEIQGLHYPLLHSGLDKRELFILEFSFVVCVLLNRNVQYPSVLGSMNLASILFLLWVMWGMVSTLLAMGLNLALISYAEQLVLLLFAVSVYAFLNTYRALYPMVMWVLVIGFFLYILFLVSNYSFPSLDGRFVYSMKEVGFRHVRHFGYYLTVMVIVGAGIVMSVNYRLRHPIMWMGVVTMIISWMFIVWLGGRGPIFALALSTVVFIYFIRPQKYKLQLALMGATFIAGVLLSWFVPGGFGLEHVLHRLVPFWFGKSDIGLVGYSSGRVSIWMECWSDIKDNPVFGVGPNGFISTCGARWNHAHILQPHGLHIQAMLDWGIGGALLFFAAITVFLNQGYARLVSAGANIPIIGLVAFWEVIMLLVFSSIDGTLYHRFSVMYFAFFIALLYIKPTTSMGSEYGGVESRIPYLILLYIVSGIIIYLQFNGYLIMPSYILVKV